ncbi:TPA: hypothetical protein PR393_002736 [Staphylococcus aureus]|nr:hypothetical protein [Staphylococcus aureus]
MIKKFSLTTVYVAFLSIVLSNITLGAENPGPKIEQGLQQVQTFLTGLIVAVGICAGVAVGAALVWLVPWVYNLFQ